MVKLPVVVRATEGSTPSVLPMEYAGGWKEGDLVLIGPHEFGADELGVVTASALTLPRDNDEPHWDKSEWEQYVPVYSLKSDGRCGGYDPPSLVSAVIPFPMCPVCEMQPINEPDYLCSNCR